MLRDPAIEAKIADLTRQIQHLRTLPQTRRVEAEIASLERLRDTLIRQDRL